MTPDEKRILDMLYIAPYDSKGTKGWLVRFRYYPTGKRSESGWHSKLFTWSLYATPNAAFDAAREYRDSWIKANIDQLFLRGPDKFSAKLPVNNTSGIVGVNRTKRILPSGNPCEEWQTTFQTPSGGKINKKFSVRKLSEIDALREAVAARRNGMSDLLSDGKFADDPSIQDLIDYYDDILSNLNDLSDMSPGRDLVEITTDEKIDGTTKFEEIQVRVGQQRFRRNVLQFFDYKCAITGSTILVRASHIKPWRVSNDSERIDPQNGLALSPIYDAAFDIGWITFRSDGGILVASGLAENAPRLGISGNEKLIILSDRHAVYLDWHRRNIFKNEANKALEPTIMAVTDCAPSSTLRASHDRGSV